MTYYLPSSNPLNPGQPTLADAKPDALEMEDLKVFWGPEICRLEYLIHLLDTGRVKDEYWPRGA